MINTRRKFLKTTIAGAAATLLPVGRSQAAISHRPGSGGPIVISTWNHGMAANERAFQVLEEGGTALDAAEQGVMVVESDLGNRSVGLGGRPDRDGHVTLDACIQDHDGRAGAVAFLEHFEHPVSIARRVMEKTPHVMLVGQGARQFALEQGFKEKQLQIPEVRKAWQEWLKEKQYKPKANIEQHDTIGMVVLDGKGQLAGSCTTSGLAYKLHGRVGDSPIIGAGLFVDGDVGAACATGVGEMVIRTAGGHSVVELMRQGVEPEAACKQVIHRIIKKHPQAEDMQVAMIGLRKDGAYGGWSIYQGFQMAVHTAEGNKLQDPSFERNWE